jgi:hypothetical protein
MELEDLKSIWKSSEPEFKPKDEQEIALMLKGKSKSIISTLKRNVWFELIFTIIVSVGLLLYAISLPPGALKSTSVALLLVCVAYVFYYIKKIIMLNRFDGMNENVRDNISMLIKNLNSYLKFYKNSYAILYPVYFVLGLIFGAIERGTAKYVQFLSQPKMIVYLIVMGGVFFFVSTKFASWYLKKLYGRHLDKLKNLLQEIRE